MRNFKKLLALLLCALLFVTAAMAEETLTARIEGKTLKVSWSAGCSGNCVLTVYRNNWPVSVCNVNGANGGASIALSDTTGKYSVRLKTASGCLTADASGSAAAQPTAKPVVTPKPTAVPTAVPTPEPTAVPTPEPTAVPTPEPTAVPTARPTAQPTAAPNTGSNQGDLAAQVVAQVNQERAKQGLNALRVDSELTRAACVRAGEIVQSFSHTRPDGRSWSTVSSSAYGENIAKGQRTADRVMAAWMSSQGHRENILRASYGSIGVCAYSYGGVIYWVQLFGR